MIEAVSNVSRMLLIPLVQRLELTWKIQVLSLAGPTKITTTAAYFNQSNHGLVKCPLHHY